MKASQRAARTLPPATGFWRVLAGGAVALLGALAQGQNLTVQGANSPYTLSSGTLTTSRLIVGDTAAGIFNHSGGLNSTDDFTLGGQSTGDGTYNLSSSGTLNVFNATIGNIGTGTFTQTGGTFDLQGNPLYLSVGGGSGTYNLDGGTLATSNAQGFSGTSTFNFNGGTLQAQSATPILLSGLTRANVRDGGAMIDTAGFNVTLPQSLLHSNLGGDAATDGGLTKTGAGTLTLAGANTYKGGTIVSAGTLAITGNLASSNFLEVDGPAASVAAAIVSGSATVDVNAVIVGLNATGSFTQSGGTLVSTTLGNALLLGDNAGSSGSYTLTSGSLTLGRPNSTSNVVFIGVEGIGNFVQSGGAVVVRGVDDGSTSTLVMGGTSTGPGAYFLSGTGSLTAPIVRVGGNGTALFDQTGGTVTLSTLLMGPKGTYRLAGGTLSAKTVTGAGGTGSIFNFEGGLLKPSASGTSFFQGITTANVRTGGVKIDTNTFDVTVAQPLLHSTIGGDAAIDGGLGKSGTGALTLTGANSYTGGTSVSGGELIAGANGTLGTGNVSVLSTAVRLTIATGVTDAIPNTARLTLAGGGTAGVADVGYLLLNGGTETVGSLMLGSTLYSTPGTFTSATYPEYLSGAGSLVVVPEPATGALLSLGLLLPASLRRRR